MADAYITDLPTASSLNDGDALLVNQSGVARMLPGTILRSFINRNVMTVTAHKVAPTSEAVVTGYDTETGALELGVPQGIGIKSIAPHGTQPTGEPELQRTYRVTYDDDTYDDVIFYDGRDGSGQVNSVDGVRYTTGTTDVALGALRLDGSVGKTLTDADLNDVLTGVMEVDGANCNNSPYAGYFLLVCGGLTGNNVRTQTAIIPSGVSPAIRVRTYNGVSWGDWSGIAISKKATVTIGTTGWYSETQSGVICYYKTVTLNNSVSVTANSKVDLQPSAADIIKLADDGVLALYIENDSGTLKVYSIDAKPSTSLTIQAIVTEVA